LGGKSRFCDSKEKVKHQIKPRGRRIGVEEDPKRKKEPGGGEGFFTVTSEKIYRNCRARERSRDQRGTN